MFENDFVERRESLRMSIACPVVIQHSIKKYREKMRNLSSSGLKLQTNNNLLLNRRYDFEFHLPAGPQIKLEGEICWRQPKGRNVYYGVKFNQLGVLPRLRLKFYLFQMIRNIRKNMAGSKDENS